MKLRLNATISIWMFCVAYLLNIHTAKADPYSESNWRVTYDNCSATITIKFWILDGRGEDDYFYYMSVYYYDKSNVRQRIFKLQDGPKSSCSFCESEFTRDGGTQNRTFAYITDVGNPSFSVTDVSGLDNVYEGTLTLRNFDLNLVGGSIDLQMTGLWFNNDAGNNDTNVDYTKTINSTTTIPARSNLTNTFDCNSITLNWTNPSWDCSSPASSWKTKIYRTDDLGNSKYYELYGSANPNNQFTDVDVVTGRLYSYSLKTGWFPGYSRELISDVSNTITTHVTDLPLAPVNLHIESNPVPCDSLIGISWDQPDIQPEEYYISKRRSRPSFSFWTVIDTIDGSLTSYLDSVDVLSNKTYQYKIQAVSDCGASSYSNTVTGTGVFEPQIPGNFTAIPDGNRILLSWNDNNSNETEYVIERTGGVSKTITLPADSETYIDVDVTYCQAYHYTLRANNSCFKASAFRASADTILTYDVSAVFNDQTFSASKGYFSDKVVLEWSYNFGADLSGLRIFRRRLQDTGFIQIANEQSGSNVYVDVFAEAGQLYEYKIFGELDCGNQIYITNEATSIGFRTRTGTITGQVSYGGGIAVKDVQINASSTSGITNKSIDFTSGTIVIAPQDNLNLDTAFLFECFIQPESYVNAMTIIEKQNNYKLRINLNNNLDFTIYDANTSYNFVLSATNIPRNIFSHIAVQVKSDTVRFYVNGIERKVSAIAVTGGGEFYFRNTSDSIVIGSGFDGKLAELRLWNIGKSATQIVQDSRRFLSGSETGLLIYYRTIEGIGNAVYDFSKQALEFNKNHGIFRGSGIGWTDAYPTSSQLSLLAYTDEIGNYILNTPFQGSGEVFIVSPSYLTHTFNPSSSALFIGDGATIHNNINFTDLSSFTVTGDVYYKNSSCGVADAPILIDGVPLIVNGAVAKTDPTGSFSIQVPIGNHFIEVRQEGHVYVNSRFPSSGSYNFQAALSGIHFIDSTLLKVVGRVVGGLREAAKFPGLGKSKNNIGVSKLIFISQLGSGCRKDTVFTNSSTGEYTLWLPPLKYVVSVTVPSNPLVNFGVIDLLDLSSATNLISKIDSTFDINGNFLINSPSISFHKQLDFIWREKSVVSVVDKDGSSSFIGEDSYTDTYGNTRNLRTNPYFWPVFLQGDDEQLYRCLIKIYEPYKNYTTSITDSVPTTEGTLKISNDLAEESFAEINVADFASLDSFRNLIYTFKPGFPNFSENVAIPEYSFTGKIEMVLETAAGTIAWLPAANKVFSIPNTNTGVYHYYLLGKRSNGQQFVTLGPQVPEYVLRDPPGTASTASRSIGTTKVDKTSWSWNLGEEAHTSDQIYTGVKVSVGVGVEVDNETENNLTAGFKAKISGGRTGSQTIETTNTNSWSTYGETGIPPGASSDLYIGKSQNVQFGVSEELVIISDQLCDTIPCLAGKKPATNLSFAKKYGLSIVPGGYSTQFMFNEYDIKNLIIPNLISLRNKILQTNPKYTSKLSVNDENYGKNNDDPVFGAAASTYTPRTGDFEDYDGPSYKLFVNANPSYLDLMNTVDSVRYVNNQVYQWEQAIYLNEWEKVNIGNKDTIEAYRQKELSDLDKQYAGIIIAYAALSIASATAIYYSYGAIAVPIVGSAFLGYATFAATTAFGIGEAEVIDEYLEYKAKRNRIVEKFESLGSPANFTFTGGTTYESEVSHSTAVEHGSSIEYELTAELGFEISGKINNNGVGIEKGLEISFTNSHEWALEESETETVTFNLNDPDIGDLYSVDVYPSILGWGPVFKNKPGCATACPFEDETVTEYYMPGTVVSPRTLQIDKPKMEVSPYLITNVPVDEAAVFNLTISNESEIGYIMPYDISVASETNPFGAIVRIDGLPGASVIVAGGTSINKVLTIEKGPGPVYNYDNILVLVHSQCQFTRGAGFISDIVDSVYVSAHFLPSCTKVRIANPDNQWVLNNSFNDTLPISIVDYNVNYFDLENLRLDYKPSSSAKWIGLQRFHADTNGLMDPNAVPIPRDKPFSFYEWDVKQLSDGAYDLRVTSDCELSELNSEIHSGIIDRINPHAFGHPSPADGILSPNDEISIKFNEPIDLGSISSGVNFDIRGVLNGGPVEHATSLSFDGVDDFLELPDGIALDRRDFTLEFNFKRDSFGEQTIFSQGTDAGDQIYIGFGSNHKLVFKINGTSVSSTKLFNDNIWHTVAISYKYLSETVEMFLADEQTTASLINIGATSIQPDYIGGNTKALFGKNSATATQFLNGNLHEVRIWTTARSLSQFSIHKSKLLSGNEAGLLYNWRMDEATGNTTIDIAKGREAIIKAATWQITPTGKSVDFKSANSNYLKASTGNIVITDEMDFTTEFWFKSGQTGNACFLSNGTGTGLSSDSLQSWNIDKVDSLIHIKHNKIDFTATTKNYFDNNWHHFAMVLKRNGNLSVYVDGLFENSISSDGFREWSGSNMWIGARGFKIATQDNVSNHYNGLLDEFRFWNVARSYEQIKRDKQNRMMGDEAGLQFYLPFEHYSTDASGIKILTGVIADQISAPHTIDSIKASLSNATPTIKLQRPVEQIAFNYSVNNDQIILTPITAAELIENVTLDVTVQGIHDLHGNTMQSPVSWIAYIDKNQVVWQDELLKYSILKGETLSFKSGIYNRGGAAKKFNILDLPSWLTASPNSGVIAPNSFVEVIFTVNSSINLGTYAVRVSLLTDFNYREKLNIELDVKAIEPNWIVNPAAYDNTMNIIGTIKINGIFSADVRDKVVAYVGSEVRGVANLEYVPKLDAYRVFLNIYNSTGNPVLTFKIWDASTGKVYSDVVGNGITFTSDSVRGSFSNPVVFESGTIISLEIPVFNGWNWICFYLDNIATTTDGVLESVAEKDASIKNLTETNTYNGSTWSGNKINGFYPTQLWKLKKGTNDTLLLRGTVVNPTTRPVTINSGWTWIGFISLRNQEINQALANLIPATGDIIKGKYNFAVYNGSGTGWLGSLKTMVPGEGYMYKSKSNGPRTFTYPIAGMFENFDELVVRTNEEDLWQVNHQKFNNNMTAIATLNTSCQDLIHENGFGIGVLDATGNWRAKAALESEAQQEIAYLTIAGDESEKLQYKLIHPVKNLQFDLNATCQFIANEHIGSVNFPYVLKMDESICKNIKYSDEVYNERYEVFPQVFQDVVHIEYTAKAAETNATIRITDMMGQEILQYRLNLEKGFNELLVDTKQIQIPGSYFISLVTQQKQFTKLIQKVN
ncbi:MAG: hypothetical protein IPG95_05095 [Saprospiraceae bacterium]|nr:hypothetical protein [Saprospiraceae bacterium]